MGLPSVSRQTCLIIWANTLSYMPLCHAGGEVLPQTDSHPSCDITNGAEAHVVVHQDGRFHPVLVKSIGCTALLEVILHFESPELY